MTDVTVDSADLETIVFATAAIKAIEGQLAARKSDPFVRPHLEFTAAHDRLVSAMRNAARGTADTVVKWDGDLDDDEMKMLKAVETGGLWITPKEKAAGGGFSAADRLAAKGCIVMGQFVRGILWGGASAPELQIDPKGFPLKITERGREKLRKALLMKIEGGIVTAKE